MRPTRLVPIGCLLVVLAGGGTAEAATPRPSPGAPSFPRCHVVAGPKPTAAARGGNVAVTVPRIACTGPSHPPVRTTPVPEPVRGPGGGATGRGGKVPFTGAELATWSLIGLAALVGGAALHAVGRRRRSS